jgi:hypothetical protein
MSVVVITSRARAAARDLGMPNQRAISRWDRAPAAIDVVRQSCPEVRALASSDQFG